MPIVCLAAVEVAAPSRRALAATETYPGDAYNNLSLLLLSLFEAGKERFLHAFTPEEGLGPVYNEASCQECHGGSGGIPGGPDALGLGSIHNVQHFGFDNRGYFDPMREFGGPLLARRTIANAGYPDCTMTGEVVPAQATIRSVRNTPGVLGLGLIDAIPDSEILSRQNLGIDGIHGVANWGIELQALDAVPHPQVPQLQTLGPARVGRFGWKAQTATLQQFSAEPLSTELGISGPYFPQEHTDHGLSFVSHLENACNVATPMGCHTQLTSTRAAELRRNCLASEPDDNDSAAAIAIYHFQALLAPAPTLLVRGRSEWSRQAFESIGCARCHVPEAHTAERYQMLLEDGTTIRVPQLEGKTFYPFSDFLLHDMGPGLADNDGGTVGRVQGRARRNYWRTTPLWGIRLKATYLHDGRTTDLREAVLAHAGEAKAARDRFARLSEGEQGALLEGVQQELGPG